ncbi:MAG: YceI family protein [Bacteroidetes bacterium]|nr:YceI family protein [Bacteroidota bacterium]MDA1120722.1 YceI family protein [Bacteroidota bacterium]
MKKLILIKALLLGMVIAVAAQTTWNADKSHSVIGFTIAHMVVSEVDGRFNDFDASLTASKDDLTDAQISFSARATSVDTGIERRDNHLRSGDFFDVENTPEISFTGTSFKKLSDGKYELTGDLTMHGVTKSVKLDVKYNGTIDTGRGIKAGFKVSGTLNRKDFGLVYGNALEAGGLVIGEEVILDIKLEMNKA